jgi:hypothetical protein
LAFAEGAAERAALLAGATDEFRRRVGIRVWGSDRFEAELVDEVRRALGRNDFDQAVAAGARLNQREAVVAVRDRRSSGPRES